MAPIQPMRHTSGEQPAGGPGTDLDVIYLAMGCFWGAEELYWQTPGVVSTAVGYMGGTTAHPSYELVCTGTTGHAETVRVEYDPDVTDVNELLKVFWESHDPTMLDRQGNDVGSQYRSAIYITNDIQLNEAMRTLDEYQEALYEEDLGDIVTEVVPASEAGPFYYAEKHHQQYLLKNPHGYRCHARTGVPFPQVKRP